MKLLALTNAENNQPIFINPDHIQAMSAETGLTDTRIVMQREVRYVKESMADILVMIGCEICRNPDSNDSKGGKQ